jgi:hypothetical protein
MVRRFVDFSLTAIAGLLIAGFAVLASTAHARQPVGSVTLVLGQATVVSPDGTSQVVRRGSTIAPGDRVETAQGGHVHIRFVDDALVSVRPFSRLTIDAYKYNPAHVTQSEVRFTLEAGVARAISGAAAEGAKERFRLNTPLVAIGVRGTDFVVNSQAEQTTVQVNQGEIVMTPLGTECAANALGPCNTSSAMLVSAQMGDVLAEYRAGLNHPESKPQLLARATRMAVVPSDGATADTQTARLDRATVTNKSDSAAAQASSAIRDEFIAAVVDGNATQPPVSVPAPRPPDLVWGHWSAPVNAEDFSQPFMVAAIGREVTVGNADRVLYRSLPMEGGATTIQPSLGQVSFNLQQANAQFRPWGEVGQNAFASNGVLSIDFAARKFETTLQLDNAIGGNALLSTAGIVLSDGIFGGTGAGQTVVGATTFDGQSAGYFFDKTVERGVFSGITLWGK